MIAWYLLQFTILCSHLHAAYCFQSSLYTCASCKVIDPLFSRHMKKQRARSQRHSFAKTSLSFTNRIAFKETELEYSLIDDINLIPPEQWDNCLPKSKSGNQTLAPFLRHTFLYALEASECVSAHRGWLPRHLQIKLNGQHCAFLPLYIKNHSMGEFIFDSEWAAFAKKQGISYYPKLLVGVPFSPVTCPKILMDPSFLRGLDEEQVKEFRVFVGKVLRSIVKENRLSSAHINFITDEEACDLAGDITQEQENTGKRKSASILQSVAQKFANKDWYFRRTTLQYHWLNCHKDRGDNYLSFEDYLSCFKSKKRIKIRRERRRVVEQQVTVDAVAGKDIRNFPGLAQRMFQIYQSTVDKMYWGNLYFTQEFFEMLIETDFVESLVFMCARFDADNATSDDSVDDGESHNGRLKVNDIFAGTINVVEGGTFYGRYWGCLPEYDVKDLHFEVCYWSAIEYCIKNEIGKMEPGAGGAEYKWVRGFDPVLIHSVHYIAQNSFRRAARDNSFMENKQNLAVAKLLNENSAVKGTKYNHDVAE